MDTVADNQARKGRNFNLRAYIAGGSATAALIAGTVIAFAALATYVGFNGVPLGDDDVATDGGRRRDRFAGSDRRGAGGGACGCGADARGPDRDRTRA